MSLADADDKYAQRIYMYNIISCILKPAFHTFPVSFYVPS